MKGNGSSKAPMIERASESEESQSRLVLDLEPAASQPQTSAREQARQGLAGQH